MTDFDDDDFVIVGEALEPLDEDNLPRKKPITIKDQYALDGQGRRRFHGAFTGGFSAGYFNTVDTRDGWRPHQFKSSRSKKAENVSQRPEDFMDDEDIGEFGIAPSSIRASSNFSNHEPKGNKRERSRTYDNGPIPGTPVLKELLKTITDTVGVKLLKKMGWKPGQGVGPRLSKSQKKKISQNNMKKKIYGCSMPGDDIKTSEGYSENSNEDDDENENISFAPDDLEPLRCNSQDNYFGIGYSGLSKLSVLSSHINVIDTSVFQMQDKNKELSIRGQAFGVGVFEAEDDNIYERDDMSRYDFALGPENEKTNRWSNDNQQEPVHRKYIAGFVLAKNRLEQKKTFNPPKLPENYEPIHVIKLSRFSAPINKIETSNIVGRQNPSRSNLNAQDREKILGETHPVNIIGYNETVHLCKPPPGYHNDVENSIECSTNSHPSNVAVKQTLAGKLSRTNIPNATSKFSWMEKLTTENFVQGGIEGPSMNSSELLKHEQPRPINLSDEKCNVETNNVKNTNIDQELHKMEQTSDLRNQIDNSEIEGKTTMNKQLNIDNVAMDAAKMMMFGKLTRTIDIWKPASAVCKRFNISEPKSGCAQPDPEKAKRYRLFESLDFHSETVSNNEIFQRATDTTDSNYEGHDKLDDVIDSKSSDMQSSVCIDELQNFKDSYKKIFNIQTEDNFETVSRSKISQQSISTVNNDNIAITDTSSTEKTKIESEYSVSNLDKNASIETKYDLFKTIFLSDDELSESHDDTLDEMNTDIVRSLLIGNSVSEVNTQRNTSPPRGIFAQINFNQVLNSSESLLTEREKNIKCKDPEKPTFKSCLNNVNDLKPIMNEDLSLDDINGVDISSNIYGPALPAKFTRTDNLATNNRDTSNKLAFEKSIIQKLDKYKAESIWVEKPKLKKLKKTKRKHKQKEKYKDRKHKHKSNKKKN